MSNSTLQKNHLKAFHVETGLRVHYPLHWEQVQIFRLYNSCISSSMDFPFTGFGINTVFRNLCIRFSLTRDFTCILTFNTVLCPQKRQSHSRSCKLIINVFVVRKKPGLFHSFLRIENYFYILICEIIRNWPFNLFLLRFLPDISYFVPGTPCTGCDHLYCCNPLILGG